MRVSDIARFSFSSLRDRRLRSTLTVLMVAIGIGLITALNGLSGGINVFITDQLNTFAPNVLTVTPANQLRGFGPPGGQGGGQGGFGGAGNNQVQRITLTTLTVRNLESLSDITHIIPSYRGSVDLRSRGKVQSIQMIGIDPSKLSLIIPTLELEEGVQVGPSDVTGVNLGFDVAHPQGEAIPFAEVGGVVRVEIERFDDLRQEFVTEGKSFIVRGIWRETGNPGYDRAIAVPLPVADSFLKKSSKFDTIYVVTVDSEMNDSVEQEMRKIYGEDLGISSPMALLGTINNLIGGFTIFLSAIGGVSILVGGVGIVTTLFTSVMERTKEIGTLKALGATGINILLLFMSESSIIGVLGSMTGLLLGAGLAVVLIPLIGGLGGGGGGFPAISPTFTPMTLITIFAIGIIVSTIAGLYPAWRAARLLPIEALRKE